MSEEELEKSYELLRQYLRQLETENRNLAVELDHKRELREERTRKHQEDLGESRERISMMDRHIQGTGEIVDRQKEVLEKMKAFYRKNEEQLKEFSRKLAGMESSIRQEGGSVESMKSDLLNMLGELKSMRQQREKFMREIV